MRRMRRGPSGTRMTRQRRVILEILGREGWHPTGDEVYRVARRRLPRISLGTVYRNLDLLSAQGLIQRVEIAGRQRRFDGKLEPHYHARCVNCGKIEDVAGSTAISVESAAANLKDWQMLGHRLELVGRCPACIAASPDPSPAEADQEAVDG